LAGFEVTLYGRFWVTPEGGKFDVCNWDDTREFSRADDDGAASSVSVAIPHDSSLDDWSTLLG